MKTYITYLPEGRVEIQGTEIKHKPGVGVVILSGTETVGIIPDGAVILKQQNIE